MLTTEERLVNAKRKAEQFQQKRKLELRKAREEEAKKNQRRNYILRELVSKYFPQVLKLEPGNKIENNDIFKPFEIFLSTLAADQKTVERLENEISKSSSQDYKYNGLQSSNCLECVSGHADSN